MSDKAEIKDKREPGFFIIDNEVDDMELSVLAFRIYCKLVRHSGQTNNPYISKSQIAKRFKLGRATVIKAVNELLSVNLISEYGFNEYNIMIYLINDAKKLIKENPKLTEKYRPHVLPQNTPCSATKQVDSHTMSCHKTPPVLPQNINKTNNTKPKQEKDMSAKPTITNQVKEIFDKGNKELNGESLSWFGHEQEYGRNINLIIKSAGNDIEKINGKAAELFRLCKSDDWYKKQGFTPSVLLSAWNKIQVKKTPVCIHEPIEQPTAEQIAEEFANGTREKF